MSWTTRSLLKPYQAPMEDSYFSKPTTVAQAVVGKSSYPTDSFAKPIAPESGDSSGLFMGVLGLFALMDIICVGYSYYSDQVKKK